jgi:signal transduction histidine kinase
MARFRLPQLFRTTPFRLTLLFLALFGAAASAFLGYIYVATAGEVLRQADLEIRREVDTLEAVLAHGDLNRLNQAIIERTVGERPFLYLLKTRDGVKLTGSVEDSPVSGPVVAERWMSFILTETDEDGKPVERAARGVQVLLPTGDILFVGADIAETENYVEGILRALWGAGALVLLLGLGGGLLVSRNVSRSMTGLVGVIEKVRGGDLNARAPVRGVRDEYDELANGLNEMLDRLERSMGSLRHAGDAIAHDLRSPLTRLRARLEVSMIEVEAGRGDPTRALETALEDTDGVLRTFNAVLAIARLQSAGQAPDQSRFDPAQVAGDLAELYEPLASDKGVEFEMELSGGLEATGNREFIAQAIANLLDNAIKYTPSGGAVMLRCRRRGNGDLEISVTDTGPGIADEDRDRVVQRFVRLENSRSQPGAGLGLSLVAAVAQAHDGYLELDEGPGSMGAGGPGLRVALVLPSARVT